MDRWWHIRAGGSAGRPVRIGLPGVVALWGLLQLAGGCALPPETAPPGSPFTRSPIELRCARTPDSVLRVTVRNHSSRATEVDLLGLAFPGHSGFMSRRGVFSPTGIRDPTGTQPGGRRAPAR